MLTPSSLPPTTLTNAFCWVHCLLVLASLPQPVQDSAMITVPCNTWLLSSAFSSLGHSLYARSWQHFLAFPEKKKAVWKMFWKWFSTQSTYVWKKKNRIMCFLDTQEPSLTPSITFTQLLFHCTEPHRGSALPISIFPMSLMDQENSRKPVSKVNWTKSCFHLCIFHTALSSQWAIQQFLELGCFHWYSLVGFVTTSPSYRGDVLAQLFIGEPNRNQSTFMIRDLRGLYRTQVYSLEAMVFIV